MGKANIKQQKPSKLNRFKVIYLRADGRKSFLDGGEEREIKTSACLRIDRVTFKDCSVDMEAIKAKFHSLCSEREATYRPLTATIKSCNGSPIEGTTPGGSKLSRLEAVGPFDMFSNIPGETTRNLLGEFAEVVDKNDESDSPVVPAPAVPIKHQSAKITAESLQKVAQITRNRKRSGLAARESSQNSVMAISSSRTAEASATRYVLSLLKNAPPGIKWEWCHALGYSIGGLQKRNNIFAGTRDINTLQLLVAEIPIKEWLSKIYRKGFWIDVLARTYHGTHLAKDVDYTVKTDDFETTFKFQQRLTKPHISMLQYSRAFLEVISSDKAKAAAGIRL